MAFPGSITLLPDVIQSSDGTYTENNVQIPGSPYIYKLGTGLPIPYPTGMQVIPPTGVSNPVTVSGGGHGSWTQVASAPAAGQFTVDTSISPTGGQIGFNSADAFSSTGLTISLTYLANTYINKAFEQAFVTALRDIHTALGAANGFAALSSAGGLTGTGPSLFSNGTFADPLVGTARGLKVSQGIATDRLNIVDPLHYSAQTGNTNTALQNQPVSTLTVPAGTVNGGTLSVNNAYCQPHSYIFFTVFQNVDVHIRGIQLVSTVAGTFTVMIFTDGTNVSSSTSVQYHIVNIATE